MTRGRFIVLEGGEGAGKSTQARLLVEALRQDGVNAILTREPGGTPGAEAIRGLLLNPDPAIHWPIEAEALLFAAARADHVAHLIKPALNEGKWVICDRFVDSNRAYQGAASGMGDDAIMRLHQIGSHGLLPDLCLYLAVTPQVAARRIKARDNNASGDRIGDRNAAYHAKVANAFATFVKAEQGRFVTINADEETGLVHNRIMKAVSQLNPA